MTKNKIDYDEIQKAMEDIEREAFDYFLDIETGGVVILSEDILQRAQTIIAESYDDDMSAYEAIELDEDPDLPDWIEGEVELALEIFINGQTRYLRIPERRSADVFQAMQEYIAELDNPELRRLMEGIFDGKGVFRRFKNVLERFPKERKQWHSYNARAARNEIIAWLQSVGITAG